MPCLPVKTQGEGIQVPISEIILAAGKCAGTPDLFSTQCRQQDENPGQRERKTRVKENPGQRGFSSNIRNNSSLTRVLRANRDATTRERDQYYLDLLKQAVGTDRSYPDNTALRAALDEIMYLRSIDDFVAVADKPDKFRFTDNSDPRIRHVPWQLGR